VHPAPEDTGDHDRRIVRGAPRRRIAFADSGNTITDTIAAPTSPAAVLARI
jgi:hypothetical protein